MVRISYGFCERVNEQVIDDDYPRDGVDQISFVGCRGVPFVVKHEDIRLVSIKD